MDWNCERATQTEQRTKHNSGPYALSCHDNSVFNEAMAISWKIIFKNLMESVFVDGNSFIAPSAFLLPRRGWGEGGRASERDRERDSVQ